MRKGFMNHWIILYSGTYVYEGGGIKKIREIIKQEKIRVNNYICSCALLFDNVHIFELKQ